MAKQKASVRQFYVIARWAFTLSVCVACDQASVTFVAKTFAADDSAQNKSIRQARVRVVDLNVGESREVTLCDGSVVKVDLVALAEQRDSLRQAIRRAEVRVRVDGEEATLVSGNYNLPQTVGRVRIDCSITGGYNENGSPGSWALDQDARLRLWPADGPLLEPGTFRYPVLQK